jgi:methionyl-tRNA formyltransferase
VLDIPPFGCLNVHPSLLPRHRGASPIASAILAGDEYTGETIMLLDAGMDSGPILAQRRVAIEMEDTTGTLTVKLAQMGAELLRDTLDLWLSHRLTPKPQDEAKATYSRPISKEEGEIDWQLPALDIWRRVRAFQPWPGCYTRWQGKIIKVLEALPLPGGGEPGRVVSLERRGEKELRDCLVGAQTGDGVLGLLRLQMEGRRAVTAAEFARGQRGFIGALLPI